MMEQNRPDRIRTLSGAWLYVDPDDARVRSVLRKREFTQLIGLTIWRMLLAEQRWTHVVDVGANYGEMLVNGGLPPDAEIIAIEPNPAIRPRLQRTLAEAGISATIVADALSDTAGRLELLVNLQWSGKTRLQARGISARELFSAAKTMVGQLLRREHLSQPGWRTVPVSVTTLSQLLERQAQPLSTMRAAVKIDVEGHEAAVLRGALAALPQLGDFAALVEIVLERPQDLHELEQHFALQLFELSTRRLVDVPAGRLRALLATKRFHADDIVVRRRT